MSWQTEPGNPMDDLAELAELLGSRGARSKPIAGTTYQQALILLRIHPTRCNRRMIVKLTLSVRRLLRRGPHPARAARESWRRCLPL